MLTDPTTHEDWIPPHTLPWYEQLGRLSGQYSLPWNASIPEPNAEAIFEEEVAKLVENQMVLDIGCGHGDFTVRWAQQAKEIVGIDITSDFIKTGNSHSFKNVAFIVGDTKNKLPFNDNEFDFAYNRKGPTSAFLDLKRVIKSGGRIISLHPGDRLSPELSRLFPHLFEPSSEEKPILERIKRSLESGRLLEQTTIEMIIGASYLKSPLDVIKVRCFGQTSAVHEMVIRESMNEIEEIFCKHATSDGLAVTSQAYIVRGTVKK
ncbi:class I SAM-dependent methyltransferase [Cohnella sp. OV330]|uniref:class I SAM-dependent methyltransferase n=1 Tax=Cohnella sp. OV330 TaxID=1855288 RepID=UPI002101C0FC|nr:class I SAM-dependent methyltransferase [Cohnella sp. OV330]